jgi:hypothetical protein
MESMSSRTEDMERILNALRSGTDTQSTNVLARLRLGEQVEEVAKTLPPVAHSVGMGAPPRYDYSRYDPTFRVVITVIQPTLIRIDRHFGERCQHRLNASHQQRSVFITSLRV